MMKKFMLRTSFYIACRISSFYRKEIMKEVEDLSYAINAIDKLIKQDKRYISGELCFGLWKNETAKEALIKMRNGYRKLIRTKERWKHRRHRLVRSICYNQER